MHSLIWLYTKLFCLSNDRSYYLNLFDHVLFLRDNMRTSVFCLNPLYFSCDNIEYICYCYVNIYCIAMYTVANFVCYLYALWVYDLLVIIE